jgi:hypothetical protein
VAAVFCMALCQYLHKVYKIKDYFIGKCISYINEVHDEELKEE